MEQAMRGAERWSWRWIFDGEPPGTGRRWLFALVASTFAVAGVAVTKAGEPAPLAVLAVFLGQVLWQPFVSVARIDRRRGRPRTDPAWALPVRPRSWYRALLGVAAVWIAVEALVIAAITRIPDRGFWWFLGLGGAAVMIVGGLVSELAAWRVQRAADQDQAGPGPAPGPEEPVQET